MSISADDVEGVDFALAAYREEGVWQVMEIAHSLLGNVETLASALRRFPATAARWAWSLSTRTSSCWSGWPVPTCASCCPT